MRTLKQVCGASESAYMAACNSQPPAQLASSSAASPAALCRHPDSNLGGGVAGASLNPASPLNIHSLLNRPFRDVSREIISSFQVPTCTALAHQVAYQWSVL